LSRRKNGGEKLVMFQATSFELSYSLKRRHVYIVLVLIYLIGLDDLSRLILYIILVMLFSDILDGIIERIWINDYRSEKYGKNWWRGFWSMFYDSLQD
jgi:hypothetical protein